MCCAQKSLAEMTSSLDTSEWTRHRKVGSCFAQKGSTLFPLLNTATAGPTVCAGIWLTYKNVMGSLMAMGGQDLFPTCWAIPVSCVNNAHIKAIRATPNLKRKKGPSFLLIRHFQLVDLSGYFHENSKKFFESGDPPSVSEQWGCCGRLFFCFLRGFIWLLLLAGGKWAGVWDQMRERQTQRQRRTERERESEPGNTHCLVALFSWLLWEIILGFSSASS